MLRFLIGAAVLYVLVVIGIYIAQNRLLFVGMARNRSVQVRQPDGVEFDRLKLANGNVFRVAVAMAREPVAVAVFFGGNGDGDLPAAARTADAFLQLQVSTIAIEYPGYADSEGTPGVASIYEAAEVAAAFIKARTNNQYPLVAIGFSLGAAPAMHLAAKGKADKAVLWAPFTSTLELARQKYWWLPVKLLLRHRFDNLELARTGTCPVLILHGDKDDVVPLSHGQRLARALGNRAQFEVVPGKGHNDAPFSPGAPGWQTIHQFVRGL